MTKHMSPKDEFYGEVSLEPGSSLNISSDEILTGIGSVLGTDLWRLTKPAAVVANVAERSAYYTSVQAEMGVTLSNPLIVWRADGTSTGLLEGTADGTNWFPLSATAGDIEMTMATAAPAGWVLAQGQTLTSGATNYPALWAACPSWRVGSNIVLPDLRSRVPVGADARTGVTGRSLGNTGGAEKVQLSKSETPLKDHMHGGFDWRETIRSFIRNTRFHSRGEWAGTLGGDDDRHLLENKRSVYYTNQLDPPAASTLPPALPPSTLPLGYGDWGTSMTGSSDATPHENMPPFQVVNYKVKV